MHKHLALCLVGLLVHIPLTYAQAQDRATVNQAIEWFSFHSHLKITKRVGLLAESHARFVGALEPMQIQMRTALDIRVSNHWSVVPFGYVYTWNPLYGKQPNTFVNNEHRFFEQVVFKHALASAKVSHRLRLEQRYIQTHTSENNEIIDHGYNFFVNRLRYKFSAVVPLSKPNEEGRSFHAVFFEELFLSFGDRVTYHEPDQNRLFAGLRYVVAPNSHVEAGPFYQMLIKSGGTRQENNIGVLAAITYDIDLSRK